MENRNGEPPAADESFPHRRPDRRATGILPMSVERQIQN
jgi:hypothetical protein